MLVSPLMVRFFVSRFNLQLLDCRFSRKFSLWNLIYHQGPSDVVNVWDHHSRQTPPVHRSEEFVTRHIRLDTLRLHFRSHSGHHGNALGLQWLANRWNEGQVRVEKDVERKKGEMGKDSRKVIDIFLRGNYRSLWMGVLWALPSGTGVAVALLQGSNGPLIGVAISASLLPPVVNCVSNEW